MPFLHHFGEQSAIIVYIMSWLLLTPIVVFGMTSIDYSKLHSAFELSQDGL